MNKTFDCVEMKRRGAERIYNLLKGMSREEKLAYWQRRSREFREEVERRKRESLAKQAEVS